MNAFVDDDLGFEVDASDVTEDTLFSGAGVSKEGFYHVVIDGVEKFAEDGKLPYLQFDLRICAGTEASQIGKMIFHKIWTKKWIDKDAKESGPLEGKQMQGVTRFAYAFGLIDESELGKSKVNIPFQLSEGRQAVVEVRQEDDWVDNSGATRKGRYAIPFNNAWPVSHERVESCPKDPELLSMLGESGQGGESLPDGDIDDL